MKEVKFDHVFECDEETYWSKIFFGDEFNRKLFLELLNFSVWKSTVHEDNDQVMRRTVEVMPPTGEVPGAVKKVLGDNFGYKEHGTFDKKTRRFHVEVESNVAKEKTKVHGDMWLERVSEKRVKRIAKFEVEVKIMMVGGLVEDRILSDMKRDFERGSEFTNKYIREKGY